MNRINCITCRLVLRFIGREWRTGELQVLAAALIIAVGSITAVGFLVDRARQAMESRGSELLAADILVSSPDPIAGWVAEAARSYGLATAHTLSFRSMVAQGDRLELAEVKAVDTGYPLRGQLGVAPSAFAEDRITDKVPAPGKVWLDARLSTTLKLSRGAQVTLGTRVFTVEQVLSYEPDRGSDLFSIAPRLLMNLEDVPSTALVQPGSRVTHRLLLAGEASAVDAFRSWIEDRLGPGERLQGVRDARPELETALARADRFMGLAALVSVLLAGVAIAVAAQRYASRHQAVAAILRCLGARQPWILRLYLGQIAAAGLLACLVGCALGYGAQSLLAALLADLFPSDLPPPSFLPVLQGLATGLVALLGFALPPLLRLRQVPPVRVFSRELGALPGQAWQGYGLALAALVVLLYWQAQDATLTLYVLGGSFAALLSLVGIALLLIRSLAKLRGRVGVAWRFGMANIARHTTGSVLQVVAFGVGIMALLLLTFVRNDLLQGWQRTLPAETPNFFLINVQPDEVPALQAYLAGRGFAHSLYPMVRARLMAINERPVFAQEFQDPRAQRLVEREFNLSWAEGLAGDNRIVEGRWWSRTEHGDPLLSVEQGVAETVGISLGDTLTFFIAGQQIQGRIVSIREVDWDSFRVNFFVLTPPGILEAFPATYVTSFYLPEAQKTLLSDLVHRFPSVTALDVHALIGKVRAIMEQVSLGMQTIFLFTFLAGLCILYAAIQSTLDERKLETAILRTLGADRTRLILGLYAEFATLGLLAGILGALGATVLGMVLAVQVFDLSYQPDLWIWVLGIVGGGVGVGLAGLLGTYSVLTQPPIRTLREL